ncbi:hypothetical protein EBS80_02130 [bacterium]|nr:hypothetical protein [bacterium]
MNVRSITPYALPFYVIFLSTPVSDRVSAALDGTPMPWFGAFLLAVLGLFLVMRWAAPWDKIPDDEIGINLVAWFLEMFALTLVAGVTMTALIGHVNGWMALPAVLLVPMIVKPRPARPLVDLLLLPISSCVVGALFHGGSIIDAAWPMAIINACILVLFFLLALVSTLGAPFLKECLREPKRTSLFYGISFLAVLAKHL